MKQSAGKHSIRYRVQILYRLAIVIIAALIISEFVYEYTSIYFRKWYYPPFSVHLNEQDLYLAKGTEYKLRVVGFNKKVYNYYTTDFKVAGVNFNGRVFAYRTGKAFIIAKVDGKKLKCRVNVLDINKKKLTMSVGESYRLKILGNSNRITYKSSNTEVAITNKSGNLKAKKSGKTVITVKTRGLTFRCDVTVK